MRGGGRSGQLPRSGLGRDLPVLWSGSVDLEV